jgi:anti-sigma factor RsiW
METSGMTETMSAEWLLNERQIMKQDPAQDKWRELLWRRNCTDPEQAELRAWLEAHPETGPDAEAEERLNNLLNRLPDAPVSSNFTARVLRAVEREAEANGDASTAPWHGWLKSLLPRVAVAVAALVLGLGFYGWHRHQVAQRAELARSLMAVSQVESLPPAAFLEDFDAIRRLGRRPPVDEELLALMQ